MYREQNKAGASSAREQMPELARVDSGSAMVGRVSVRSEQQQIANDRFVELPTPNQSGHSNDHIDHDTSLRKW